MIMDDDQRKAMFAKKNGNGSKPASNTIDSNATKVSKQVPVTTKTFGLSKNVLSEIKSQVGNDVEVDEVGSHHRGGANTQPGVASPGLRPVPL